MAAIAKDVMQAARECAAKVIYAQSRKEDIANVIAIAINAERKRAQTTE